MDAESVFNEDKQSTRLNSSMMQRRVHPQWWWMCTFNPNQKSAKRTTKEYSESKSSFSSSLLSRVWEKSRRSLLSHRRAFLGVLLLEQASLWIKWVTVWSCLFILDLWWHLWKSEAEGYKQSKNAWLSCESLILTIIRVMFLKIDKKLVIVEMFLCTPRAKQIE